jgi:hypothetical protein
MHHKTVSHLVVGLGLALASAGAMAQITAGWGVYASAGTAGNCPSFCTGELFSDTSNGVEFSTSALAANNTYGSSWASASFAAGASYLPELKTYATSVVGKQGSATAFSAQGFQYTGAQTTNISLVIQLTGLHSNNNNGSYVNNTTGASIAVMKTDYLPWFPSFATLVFEGPLDPDDIPNTSLSLNAASSATVANGTLSFDLAPGEWFYVVAQMNSVGQNGVADASSTLVMNFSNATGISAVSAVPEPQTALMLLAGLAGLVAAAKRKTKTA